MGEDYPVILFYKYVELADPAHLHSLISALKHLDGVFDAYRQLPGKKA